MKYVLVLLLAFLSPCTLLSQNETTGNNTSKFKLHSTSLSIGAYGDQNSGGLYISGDVGFSAKKHIFKVSALAASEFTIFGTSGEQFNEIDLLYGREWTLSNWFFIDTFAGVGYFTIRDRDQDNFEKKFRKHTIGFPLQMRFRFKIGDHFGAGLQAQGNLNSASNYGSLGSFVQFSF